MILNFNRKEAVEFVAATLACLVEFITFFRFKIMELFDV